MDIMKNSHFKKLRVFGLLIVFILIGFFSFGCSSESKNSAESSKTSPPKVTIGIQVSPAMTLAMVSKDKGFFLEEGVDVEIKEFTAGKFALQAFLSGSIDFAISGEVPVALASLQGNQIRVVAQVVEKTINEVRVVALNEEKVDNPMQYFKSKKRKLATSFGGGPEFFTYKFLKLHNIKDEEIEILSQKPEDMPAALESRSVDAISIFDPFAYIAEKRMGGNAITFKAPDIYSELYVLDARPEQIANQPEIIEAILRGLVRGAEFIKNNPEESKQILQKYTKLDREIIDGVWNNFSFKPALTQELLDYWNEQAAWAKETEKVRMDTKIPDFRKIIEDRFLKKIDPSLVQLSN